MVIAGTTIDKAFEGGVDIRLTAGNDQFGAVVARKHNTPSGTSRQGTVEHRQRHLCLISCPLVNIKDSETIAASG